MSDTLSTLPRAAAGALPVAVLAVLLAGCPQPRVEELPPPASPDSPDTAAAPSTAYEDVDPPEALVPLSAQAGYAPPAVMPAVDASTGWYDSPEALARAVVTAAAAGDPDALGAFRVGEVEHEHLLWPYFDSSDPSLNIPHGFAYTNLDGGSRQGQRALVKQLAGGTWTVAELRFEKPEDAYPAFVLHQGTALVLTSGDGARVETDLLGSVVEHGGRYKLLSFREP